MEKSTNTFSYKPLGVGMNEIRLLILEPSTSFNDEIHCRVFHATLDTHPPYEALSYYWGDATITAPISLHQETFNVTTNLESALRHLRKANAQRTLWVDAICINQLDDKERSAQVAIMGKIYKSASCTVMWLGPGAVLNPVTLALCQMEFPSIHLLEERVKIELQSLDESTFNIVLEQLCQILGGNKVWKRIWVVQEVTFAETLLLLYGFQILSWWPLYCILYGFIILDRELERDVFTEMATRYDINMVMLHRRATQILKNDDKMSLWLNYRDLGALHATDPRDRIYALLNLSEDRELLGIKPDYTIFKEDLIRRVVRSHIMAYRRLDFLELCSVRFLVAELDTSWTAGIAGGRVLSFPLSIWDEIGKTYHASGLGGNFRWASLQNPTDPRKLALSGVLLDTVEAATDTTWNVYDTLDIIKEKFLKTKPTDQFNTYFNGETNFDAYWRTLLYDSVASEFRRLKDEDLLPYREAFNSILATQDSIDSKHEMPHLHLEAKTYEIRRTLAYGNRRFNFGLTTSGYMAMFPECTQKADIVTVLYGGRVPFILRACPENEGEYLLVGPAYVHGFMDGEAMTWHHEGRLKEHVFTLI